MNIWKFSFYNSIFSSLADKRWFLYSIFIFSFFLLILRRPDSVFNAQPWAEDGRVLLQNAIYHPWGSIFFHSADYFYVIPQLVATVSLYVVGLSQTPLIMNLVAILVPALIGVYFASKQFRFVIKNDLLRGFCSLFFVLIPGNFHEPYHNITNIQSFIPIFPILFTIQLLFNYNGFKQRSKLEKIIFSVILSLIFLTGIISDVVLPFFLFVIIRELKNNYREIKPVLTFLIPTIFLIFHLIFFYFNHSNPDNTLGLNKGELTIGSVYASFINMLTIIITQLFYHSYEQFNNYFGTAAYVLPTVVVFFILYKTIKHKSKLDFFILGVFLTFPLFSIVTRPFLLNYFHDLFTNTENARYFVIPIIFVLISLVRQFELNKSTVMNLIFIAMLVIIIVNIISGFVIPEFSDLRWKELSKIYVPNGTDTCHIPINPIPWAVQVPCLSSKP